MTYGTENLLDIINSLFEKDRQRLQNVKTRLIEENHELGNPIDGFLFSGKFWTDLPIPKFKSATKKMLHPLLHEKGREFIADLERTTHEQSRIRQGLHILLRECTSEQDLRDAVPDIIVHLLPTEVSQLPRTRNAGWTLEGKPLQQAEFEQIERLLGFYVANGILY